MTKPHTKRRRPSRLPETDSTGGKLRPIPMSTALRDALTGDAQARRREPHLHALVILNHYYGLGPSVEALDPNPEALRRTRAALEPKGSKP